MYHRDEKEEDKYIFIDFSLSALLGRLGLVELNPSFNTFTTFFYKAVGFSLMAFAFFAIIYAIADTWEVYLSVEISHLMLSLNLSLHLLWAWLFLT